jgi:lactococcin 972 family bacteriocin
MNARKAVLSVASGALLSIGIAAPAMAFTTDYVSGGTWYHGTGGGKVVSNYYHGGRYHKSSVKYGWGDGTTVSSGCRAPGYWSYASHDDTIWTDNAYYNFCD